MSELAPQAVAARDLHRQTGERHQGIHEIGIGFPPHERVHAAHRGAHHQPQVVDFDTQQQRMLRGDHVRVGVLRKARVQAVAGFAGFSVSDPVRQYDEILVAVEQLTASEQHAGEMLVEQAAARAAGAVQDQHRIVDLAVRVAPRLAQHRVVQAQFRQHLAGCEMEIVQDVVAFDRGVAGNRLRADGADAKTQRRGVQASHQHQS